MYDRGSCCANTFEVFWRSHCVRLPPRFIYARYEMGRANGNTPGSEFESEHGHALSSCWEPAIGSTRPKTRDSSRLGVKLGKRTYWLVRYLWIVWGWFQYKALLLFFLNIYTRFRCLKYTYKQKPRCSLVNYSRRTWVSDIPTEVEDHDKTQYTIFFFFK